MFFYQMCNYSYNYNCHDQPSHNLTLTITEAELGIISILTGQPPKNPLYKYI